MRRFPLLVILTFVVGHMALASSILVVHVDAQESDENPTIRIMIHDRDGALITNEPFRIMIDVPNEDDVQILRGTIPEDGIVLVPAPENGAPDLRYVLKVGRPEWEIAYFYPNDDAKAFEFLMPPRPGDIAPDIVFTELFSGETARLYDYRGQIVFLDFWASWCGPCYRPMAKNQSIMERRGKEWDSKAIIIALSIDQSVEPARQKVRQEDWSTVKHYWSEEGPETGWHSDAPRRYGIDGIPTAFLIDQQGKILWTGDPNDTNPEKRIDRILGSD